MRFIFYILGMSFFFEGEISRSIYIILIVIVLGVLPDLKGDVSSAEIEDIA